MPGVMRVGDRESGGRRSSEEIDNPDGGGNKRQRAESKKKEMHQKKAAGDDLHDLLARWRQVSGEGESEGEAARLSLQRGSGLCAGNAKRGMAPRRLQSSGFGRRRPSGADCICQPKVGRKNVERLR